MQPIISTTFSLSYRASSSNYFTRKISAPVFKLERSHLMKGIVEGLGENAYLAIKEPSHLGIKERLISEKYEGNYSDAHS